MTYRKKLIEVALPLMEINDAAGYEKKPGIGAHPRSLHWWWARRPLAIAKAVIFAQIVDDPSSDPAFDDYSADDREDAIASERTRLHDLIRELVIWKNADNQEVLNHARTEIARSIAQDKLDSGDMTKETVIHDDSPTSTRGFGDESKTVLWDLRRRAATDNAVQAFLTEHAPGFHDPFAGGGALPLEAQRLGLNSHASDLNPVAVLINKAMIEIPPKFANQPPVNPVTHEPPKKDKKAAKMAAFQNREWHGAQGLAEDVRLYGQWMRDEAEKRIGHLYPKVKITQAMIDDRPDLAEYKDQELTVIAWLWARTVKSPNPAYSHVDVPLASTFMLSTKKGKEAYVEPVIDGDSYRFTVKVGAPDDPVKTKAGTKLSRGANFECLISGIPISPSYVKSEGFAGRLRETQMAIVLQGARRRIYVSPMREQEDIARTAKPSWRPNLKMPENPRWFSPPLHGLPEYGDLFTSRQLVALTTFSDLVGEVRERIRRDALARGLDDDDTALHEGGTGAKAYAEAVSVYLGFAVDRLADFGGTLATWKPSGEQVMHLFVRQSLAMTWDFPESNFLGDSGINFSSAVKYAAGAILKLGQTGRSGLGHAVQDDASTQTVSQNKIISTDPPYYDNIGYADLSDFFYVWLRRSLQEVYPRLFATVSVAKAEELVATPYRHGSKDNAEKFFLDGMTEAMSRLSQQAYSGSPVTIYYAFKQSETKAKDGSTASTGWETFLEAVVSAGFTLTGTWPMAGEQKNRMVAMGTNALARCIVLVCRPRPTNAQTITRGAFARALQNEMPEALSQMLAANIAPVDLPQSCIGPGMAIFTRYKEVLNQDDSQMSVRDALELINQAIDNFFSEQEDDFDSYTRFALTWFDQHGFNEGDYGEAESLANARNVSIEGVAQAGILAHGEGKVRLLRRDELEDDWDPRKDDRLTVWEALQYLVRELETGSESSTSELAAKLSPHHRAMARSVAYRLYTECERKGDAAEARAYNALVMSWPEIERLAGQTESDSGETRSAFE